MLNLKKVDCPVGKSSAEFSPHFLKHTSSMFPLISSVLPAKNRNIAPWSEEKNPVNKRQCQAPVFQYHMPPYCLLILHLSQAHILYSNYSRHCLTKTLPLWFSTHCVRAVSLLSGMGWHVDLRWSGNRDWEFMRV